MNKLPLIVDIKRNSLEDGPGIRSVVFFKGCPLRCIFCHNPEAQDTGVEIAFFARKCIRCGKCADICPQGAIDLDFPGRIHREMCNQCGKCVSVCPGNGLRIIGSYFSVDELTEVLLRDFPFYRHSEGGVTLSGGECTLYPDYLELLLKQLKAGGVHIVLETSGYFNYDIFRKKILPNIDIIYFDIKLADPEVHKRYTGKSNRIILDNLCRLLKKKRIEIHPRIPLIPGITATEENLLALVNILFEAGARDVYLLPYNPMGTEKFANLGRANPFLQREFMKPDEEREVYTMFKTIIKERKETKVRNYGKEK